MFNEIIVCEGIHDEERLKSFFPGVETISVNGSEISQKTKDALVKLSKSRKLILFFDPDYPGQRIRSIIGNLIPEASHAFILKKDGISKNKKKVGIEHASKEVIEAALKNKLTCSNKNNLLSSKDLFNARLIGYDDSKKRREILCCKLHIDNPNGKTLLSRLNMLGLTSIELEVLINESR